MIQNIPGVTRDCWRWALCALTTVGLLTPALLFAPFAPTKCRRLLDRWCRRQLAIFGITVSVTDHNNHGYDRLPYLYVILNQTSLCEVFLIQYTIPTLFEVFLNIEYALLPFLGWLLWLKGGVVIVRQWGWQARRGVDNVSRRLRRGKSFYMSVEGQRSTDGRLHPYRKGAAVMAIQSQATIIPIVIRGAREIMSYGTWRIRPGHAEVVLCEEIATVGMTSADRQALLDRLRAVAKLHPDFDTSR